MVRTHAALIRTRRRLEVRRLLREKPSVVDERDAKRNTALMLCAETGSSALAVAEALLEAKAEVDAKNSSGMTPLMWAARHNRIEIVKALLAAGADEDVCCDDGWCARDIARHLKLSEIVALLRPPRYIRWIPNREVQLFCDRLLSEHGPQLLLGLVFAVFILSKIYRMFTGRGRFGSSIGDISGTDPVAPAAAGAGVDEL
eukprot:TRINITY_DN6874_c0_g1_i1.p1 TRINITY_DN6874_c0_g1~~TRINITY_DN6874_c0_g1_i1.p1  ORF type:complete len:201 (-),score=45.35 TRINITY_DN6874_c0_g1_i1:435-1037(-)